MNKLICGFSGGKDSTAMVLAMHERGEDFAATGLPVFRDPGWGVPSES